MPKLTVQFTGNLYDTLTTLAHNNGIPRTEVIRRAIALLRFVHQETGKGNKLSVLNAAGHVIKDLVL